jgi:spore photoproduct lyase
MQKPDKIYIEEKVRYHPFTQKILRKLEPIHIEFVEDWKKIGETKPFPLRAAEDKNSLALGEKKGEVLKSIGRMESGEYYLFHEIDCKYDCEYCYLQYYFQTKVPVIFVNRDEVLKKMEEVLKTHPRPYFHAGEVSDALAFDHLTEFSLDIARLFSEYKNGIIEFRTKSTNISNLLSIEDPPRNLIPSWTISPEKVVKSIEHKTPSFSERLSAARRCQEEGYTIGVRLDPVILYEGWERDYEEMVKEIFSTLDSRKIDYISLGTIKLHKLLIEAISERFPENPALLDELVPADDGKYRYLKFKRVDAYRKMISWIRRLDNRLEIKLSMESKEVKDLAFNTFDV